MSFVDQDNSRERALSGAVTIAVVGCIGYALASGLAMSVIRTVPWEIPAASYRAPPPPPPPRPEPIRKTIKAPSPGPTIVTPIPQIHLPPIDTTQIETSTGTTTTVPTTTTGTTTSPPLPTPDLSTRARPVGRPGDWVTTDDYPASALRAGAEGRTSFRLDLGVDGRPTGCTVTASSGSDELDRTACRLLQHRAHFSAALDAKGQPTASTYAGSVVWRAPAD